MSDPFIGEIRMFGGNFPPRNWAFCNGQSLSISEYDALFALIGTTYGGDGQNTFGLPDLRGRIPVGEGSGPGLTPRVIGESAGTETVTLMQNQLPTHSHAANVTAVTGNLPGPTINAVPAALASPQVFYAVPSNVAPQPHTVAMNPASIGPAGGNQPHDNIMPSLCVSFIIALAGVFPSRN